MSAPWNQNNTLFTICMFHEDACYSLLRSLPQPFSLISLQHTQHATNYALQIPHRVGMALSLVARPRRPMVPCVVQSNPSLDQFSLQ